MNSKLLFASLPKNPCLKMLSLLINSTPQPEELSRCKCLEYCVSIEKKYDIKEQFILS